MDFDLIIPPPINNALTNQEIYHLYVTIAKQERLTVNQILKHLAKKFHKPFAEIKEIIIESQK